MTEFRDFPSAAADISTAYAHFVLRTTAHSERTMHLCEQVIGCVARRQLNPDSLQQSLAEFVREHASQSAALTTAAAARLLAGLASSEFLPADSNEPLPDFDFSDLTVCLQRLGDHTAGRNARALAAYQEQLAEVAAGKMTTYKFRRGIGKQYNRVVTGELTRVARLWFDFLGDLEDIRARFAEQYLLAELRNVAPLGFDASVVELTGPINTTSSAEISVENTGAGRSLIQCSVSDVRRADGIGPAFAPEVVLTPAELLLDRGRDASLRLSLRLDETIYQPGVPYIGVLHLVRAGEPRLDLPLRIRPSVGVEP